MKPFWVTFYSYKGGVGRSMALVNLAVLLAKRSRRVLMIDFDLEAPGLDSFQDLGLSEKKPGVVEYAYEFRKTNIAPDIEPFIQECEFKYKLPGKVWLMSSGTKDEAYNTKRIKLNWEELYDEHMGEMFVENWKAAINRKYRPDYVFVDSRTGLTDIGGICTLHLPDLVVLLFGLNDQNVHGISAVVQTIRNAKTIKPPQILPVATPVPNLPRTDKSMYQVRMEKAEKLLGIEKIDCSISYNAEAALVEKVFTLEDNTKTVRISAEYETLLAEIQKRDQNGLDALILQVREALKKDDETLASRLKQFLLDDFSERADALYNIGQIERRFGSREAAAAFWHKAVEIDPNQNDAFNAVATYYRQQNQMQKLVALHNVRVRNAKENNIRNITDIMMSQGEDLMLLGRYSEASEAYREIIELDKFSKQSFANLVYSFNAAESARRVTKKIDRATWESVIAIFEKLNFENSPVYEQANVFQAIHIAHACIGSFTKAKELLEKAEKCALATGKAGTIFSVKTYSRVSPEDFLAVNKEMMEALQAGRLWDGMQLPLA